MNNFKSLKGVNIRREFILITFALLMSVLIFRGAYLMLNPEWGETINLIKMNRPIISVELLAEHNATLHDISKNIDKYSFSEIRRAFDKTLHLVDISVKELASQEKAWLEIKASMKQDGKSFKELGERLSQIQRLQDEEIMQLKDLIDSAQKPSLTAIARELFVTFILGVISSTAFQFGYSRLTKRKP